MSVDINTSPISVLSGQNPNSQQGATAVTAVADSKIVGLVKISLADSSQPNPSQARPAKNKLPGSNAALLNHGCDDVASCMATIWFLAAECRYKCENIELVMLNSGIDCSHIVTLGEFQRNF